jgi:hypothetical protein
MMKQGLGSPGQEPILHLCYPGIFHVESPSKLWSVLVVIALSPDVPPWRAAILPTSASDIIPWPESNITA